MIKRIFISLVLSCLFQNVAVSMTIEKKQQQWDRCFETGYISYFFNGTRVNASLEVTSSSSIPFNVSAMLSVNNPWAQVSHESSQLTPYFSNSYRQCYINYKNIEGVHAGKVTLYPNYRIVISSNDGCFVYVLDKESGIPCGMR